jgi:hypothetical protein
LAKRCRAIWRAASTPICEGRQGLAALLRSYPVLNDRGHALAAAAQPHAEAWQAGIPLNVIGLARRQYQLCHAGVGELHISASHCSIEPGT